MRPTFRAVGRAVRGVSHWMSSCAGLAGRMVEFGAGPNGTARDGAVPLHLPPVRYSVMEPAVTAWGISPAWVISTLRGLASSATGMVRVSTPFS